MLYVDIILGVAAMLAVIWFIGRFRRDVSDNERRKRQTMGYCDQCGYDLRSSPDRCPECGAVRTRR